LTDKPVWRDIEIFGVQTMEILAATIIQSMDWLNDHLHGFTLPIKGTKKRDRFATHYDILSEGFDDDPYPTLKTSEVRVCYIDYHNYPRLRFMFDYGVGYGFDVAFRGVRELSLGETADDFPVLIDQRGVAPEQYPSWT